MREIRRGRVCIAMLLAVCTGACASPGLSEHHMVQTPDRGVDSHLGQYDLPLSREHALEILLGTDTFADTHVGYAGVPSCQACAFRKVLDQPDADNLFKQILSDGHMAGRLYALCGLFFTDHERFLQAIEPYRKLQDAVATFQGCLLGDSDVASLVEQTDPSVVRLRDPTETTEAWLARNAGLVSTGYRLDIIGGGWPARLKEIRGCDG